ncbi:TetR/AcrR family transcriptional regulator [Microbacterium gorillae]|uniref:TetR/AcrR family transcriptional regulator n=1 Tax=Microbacterium gorillae TaxID=1231063 RepID=UPI00058C2463|nr:TetR/AcrR family transcriptional regulator [Microbacterium gorillae]
MARENRQGRPRASSRETLAEAACELFFEQGYEATSVSDITARAGVSRSSFFNYFASKHDVLWFGVDERIDALVDELAGADGSDVADVLARFADGLAPDSLALALANAEPMGAAVDLDRESSRRARRIATAVAARLRSEGVASLRADVLGSAFGGGLIASIWRWAQDGPGTTALADRLAEALSYVAAMPGAPR